MVNNNRRDLCFNNKDEGNEALIKNCNHSQLFLCLDQSRCLPKRLQCNGILNCIDGSDEIEGCKNSTTFQRYFLSNKTVAYDLSNLVIIFTNESFSDILNFNQNEILRRSKLFFQNYNFGLKCETKKRNDNFFSYQYLDEYLFFRFKTVPQPKRMSNKTFCANKEDKCFDKHGNFNCFQCFDGTIILKRQVCDGLIDCPDLSDECTCEKSKVKQLCDVFITTVGFKRNKYILILFVI